LHIGDNLDQLLYLICLYIHNFVFSISRSADPIEIKLVLIRRLGQELHKAVINKLKQYFPKDANRGDAKLLSSHPDGGGEILQQALSQLLDLWVQDKGGPEDILVVKCQRLLPLLNQLPDLRGKSSLGETSRLFGLVLYDDVRALLKELPPTVRRDNLTEDDVKRRRSLFSSVLSALRTDTTGLYPPPSPVLQDIFSVAAKSDYKEWMTKSRTEIALEIVVKVIEQTPDYFLHSVKKLRQQALTIGTTALKPTI
jgi:hypothetical protein